MNTEDSKACRSAPSEFHQTFHLEIFSQFLNLNNFRVKFFAPVRGKVALANENYLIISDGVATDTASGSDRSRASDINTLIEFNELAGKPTVLLWISDNKICVGYDTGNLACFDVNGDIIFEQKLSASSVQAIQISDDDSVSGGNLWVMHAKGHLITVSGASQLSSTFAFPFKS
jgi:outer membrane protein assembly factor BamB